MKYQICLIQGEKRLKIIELFRDIHIEQDLTRRDVEILGVCSNSGEAKSGDLFVCIEGLHSDGHKYARAAVERGAVAVL